jgi:predicted phosphodiesterase
MKTFKKTFVKLPDFLVVGDIHGDYEKFVSAKKYAEDNGLLFISLGDVLNYGQDGVKIFFELKDMIDSGNALMVAGNHERKIFNYYERVLKGFDPLVKIDTKHQMTIDSFDLLGNSTIESFMSFSYNLPNMIEGIYHDKQFMFTHGAVNRLFWKLDKLKDVGNYSKIQKALYNSAMFGDFKDFEEDSPMLNYGWTKFIPLHCEVFVGHMPMDSYTVFENESGGICHLIDTGCSKGGYLTGLHYSDNVIKEIKFT